MNNVHLKLLLTVTFSFVVFACASRGTEEIGSRAMTSPEEHQHYLTISDAFARHDTNADGFLDRHEYTQLQNDPEIVRVRAAIAEMASSGPFLFEEVDENEDGNISLTELTVIIQPLIPNKNN